MDNHISTQHAIDPFTPVNDYPPERLAHDAAVAIKEAIDSNEFSVRDKNALLVAWGILEVKTDVYP